jgi:transmembrane sensor
MGGICQQNLMSKSCRQFMCFFTARFFMRFAAVSCRIGMSAGLVWFKLMPEVTSHIYRTGNGETVTFKLSDSSQIVLNANSSLKVVMHSGLRPSREAWIEGEAFFKIKKQKSHTSFTVHTSNVDVNVLGTEFNVSDRRDMSTVVLQSGQIKISNTIGRVQEVMMKPGDLAAFADTSSRFQIRLVNPENYNSWIYQKLVFDHTSISDVAHMLEDQLWIFGGDLQTCSCQKNIHGHASFQQPTDFAQSIGRIFQPQYHATG